MCNVCWLTHNDFFSWSLSIADIRYGLCERKVGKPMPADNNVVAEARLLIGLDMVLVQDIFEEYKETVDNAIRDR